MKIEQAIVDVLTHDAGMRALLYSSANDEVRIYPEVLPQAPDYPAMTYTVVAGDSQYHMQGPADLASTRVQFDLFAETASDVIELKAAFMSAFSGFRHDARFPGPIQGAFKLAEFGGFEGALDKSGPRVRRRTIDFNIWHKETAT